MARSVLVTGGNGFIGRNLVEGLDTGENQIFVLARGPCEVRGRRVTLVQGDICRPETLSSVMEQCDTVFHCAGHVSFRKKDFSQTYRVNVGGTRNVLEAASRAGVRKVVHLSACAVLGFSRDPLVRIDESASPFIEKGNIYAYTKLLAEEEVRRYVRKGLNVSMANIATVYGPGDRKLNSGSVITSIYRKQMRLVPPGGTSFITVKDLVSGLQLLSENGRSGERYIFCAENLPYRTLVERIAQAVGVSPPVMVIPKVFYLPALWMARLLERASSAGADRVGLVSAQIVKESFGYKYFDSGKARRELGWSPSQTLEDAVQQALAYYRAHHLL
jgi:dihydroflavonol-4-reductase